MKRFIVLSILSSCSIFALLACSAGPTVVTPADIAAATFVSTPPIAVATPNLLDLRPDVVTYLTAFDKIDNDYWTALKQLPPVADDVDNLPYSEMAIESGKQMGQWVAAVNTARQRLDSLLAAITPELITHLDSAKTLYQDWAALLIPVVSALNTGDRYQIIAAMDGTLDLDRKVTKQVRSLKTSTEALLEKYNIRDPEVDYQNRSLVFRGTFTLIE
jgi:hypothetical protein